MNKKGYGIIATVIFFTLCFGTIALASTITTILGTDTLSASRTVINTNFSNLNSDKVQSGDTVANLTITRLAFSANATTSLLSATKFFAGGTATTSIDQAGNLVVGGSITLSSALPVTSGGTGLVTLTLGDTLYASSANTLSALTGGVANNGKILTIAQGIPSWVATTTFGTGLTYSAGAVTVNTTQNITKLSGLTTNGIMYTSGSDGTLNIDGTPLDIALGGTNATTYTASNALVAYDGTRLVSYTGYSLVSTKLTAPAASTTNLTASTYMEIPVSAGGPGSVSGQIGIDSTTGQLRYYDGSASHTLIDEYDKSFNLASTTPDATYAQFSNATSTWYVWAPFRNVTLTKLYCRTDANTLIVNVGTGSATSTNGSDGNIVCTPGGTTYTMTTTNTFSSRTQVVVGVGSATTSTKANRVTITATFTEDAD